MVGTESRAVNFHAANEQFSFLTISLVYDRSDQHRSVYDSYNMELADTKINRAIRKCAKHVQFLQYCKI